MTPQTNEIGLLELHAIVNYLLTERECPVIFDGRQMFIKCPGVSRESFAKAIKRKAERNMAAAIQK